MLLANTYFIYRPLKQNLYLHFDLRAAEQIIDGETVKYPNVDGVRVSVHLLLLHSNLSKECK